MARPHALFVAREGALRADAMVQGAAGVDPASVGGRAARPPFEALPSGAVVEVCGRPGRGAFAQTTWAAGAVLATQRRGEPAAWIEAQPGLVFAPDLAEHGIDLAALPFVRVPPGRGRRWAAPLLRAAEILLRSGGFGLVVVDLRPPGPAPPVVAPAGAARLSALARRHRSCVLLLSCKDAGAPSLGPMVGLRLLARRTRHAFGVFAVSSDVVRNKLGAPAAGATAFFRGPHGCF